MRPKPAQVSEHTAQFNAVFKSGATQQPSLLNTDLQDVKLRGHDADMN